MTDGIQYKDPPIREVLSSVLRNNIIFQIFLYGTIQNILSAVHSALIDDIIDEINRRFTPEELTTEQAADAVVQNAWDYESALREANTRGIDKERFDVLVALSGNPPGPEFLAQALRWGLIPEKGRGPDATSYEQGIAEGRLKNKWAEIVKLASRRYPTVLEIIEAVIKSQVDEQTGRKLYEQAGGVPEFFELFVGLTGEAPTPLQAAEAAHRGIIPWEGTGPNVLSFEQAVRESRYRTKWLPMWRELSKYVPPPRTVVTLYREGTIDKDKAAELLRRNGLEPELVEAYLRHAKLEKTKRERDLTVEQILLLYEEQYIKRDVAVEWLTQLGYDADEVEFILVIPELRRLRKFEETYISRIHNQFINHKITYNDAVMALDQLGIPADARDNMLQLWEAERAVNVRTLTPSEYRRALRRGIIDEETAVRKLMELGYSEEDARIYIRL